MSVALRPVISACQAQGLRFVYALWPGLDIHYSRSSDLECLRARFEQMLQLGCEDFCLLFDDIPDVLDPALLRPGRFDRRVVVGRPDVKGREQILRVHTKKVPLSDDVDLSVLGRGTPGFAGADLANLVNEAALIAARQNRKVVTMYDFEHAKDKVIMGTERKSMMLTNEEKTNTAYHEAGHALVAVLIPHADPLHKVTIIPRGMALGLTMQLPIDDKHSYHKEFLESQLAILMAGRIAEEIFMKHVTTGAGNDIERATDMARKMVCEWGMSEVLGPLAFGQKEEQIFLGRDIAQHRDYSEQTAQTIDREIRDIVDRNYRRAREILTGKMEALHALAGALLEYETVDGAEVDQIVRGEKIVRVAAAPSEDSSGTPPSSGTAPVTSTPSGATPAPLPV